MIMSTPFPPQEGIGRYVSSISQILIERGHDITVITRSPSHRTRRKRVGDIQVIEASFLPVYPFHVSLHGVFVERQIRQLCPDLDIVHIHTPLSPAVGTEFPIISTLHSTLLGDAGHYEFTDLRSIAIKLLTYSFGRHSVSELIRRSEIVTTVSRFISDDVKKHFKVEREPVIIGNGVNCSAFSPSSLSSNKNYVLYVGRLSYGKGLFDLLESARHFTKSGLFLVLAGKGVLEERLRKQAQTMQIGNKVIFAGQLGQEDLVRLYRDALALVVSSRYEAGPLVLLEAMACGTPVISTPVGIATEAINNRSNGIIVPQRSPEKIAEAVLTLSQDDQLRKKLSRNARRTILEKFTWESVANKVEECYRSV